MLGLVMMLGFERVPLSMRSCISCLRQNNFWFYAQIFVGSDNIH